MPCLRGIEVFLTTKPDDERIPEYPHPEGTSARILGNASTAGSPSRKAGPKVSVYIPSVPATPFAVNYSISNAPSAPCKYVFFRLYMNARPIAAWGIDPAVRSDGRVVKSLWAPGALYHDHIGFEGRNFVFLPGQEYKSVAEDGGLIEIQVFRAKERRARAPRVEEFRFQENYGIAAPSIGLLDQPQDACFYDWRLLDAKDSPFATFRIHYRSLKNLRQLNLIPANELELLCSISPRSIRNTAKADQATKGPSVESPRRSCQSGNLDGAVFHDCDDAGVDAGDEDDDSARYFLRSPPELFPPAPVNGTVPQPSKAQRDAYLQSYLQRPLPELPIEEPSRLSRRSSVVSMRSTALSITPSLLQYADEGSLQTDEVELGIARLVRLPSSEFSTLSIGADEEPSLTTVADHSVSDYERSPKSPGDSVPSGKLSPGRYLPMTGSVLERGIAFLTSPKPTTLLKRLKSSSPRQSSRSDSASDQDLLRLENMSESEWNNHNPSPTQARAADLAARRGHGSRTEQDGGGSLFAGLRRKRFSTPPREPTNLIGDHNVSRPSDRETADQWSFGVWI